MWSIFDLVVVCGSLALNGARSQKGFWVTFVALLVAITIVGGALMAYLIRSARNQPTEDSHNGTGTEGVPVQDQGGPHQH